MIQAKILKDSITDGGNRLTTWEWTYPRMIHAEIMTHRALSKNSASSRAIPTTKLRNMVSSDPAVPIHWGAKQAGMQADAEIDDTRAAEAWWLSGMEMMTAHHAAGETLGLHKQVVNRVIEPWMNITIIVSGTDWANFFHLRKHKDAEPNFQKLAALVWEEYHENMPVYIKPGGWHMPLVGKEDWETIKFSEITHEDPVEFMKKVSVGRCARVSYLTHDGQRDLIKDVELHDRLLGTIDSGGPGHLSPFEHVAMAVGKGNRHGNFEGWKQYRKFFKYENGPATDKCPMCGCWEQRHVTNCLVGRRLSYGK